jgi:AbrB family looped-hinge helix DNA binding protein
MTATLSSKGQVVLPKQARLRLRLQPGTRFSCKVEGKSIVLTPEQGNRGRPKLISDAKTGLRITQSPAGIKVTNAEVRVALSDFKCRNS